MNQPNLYKWAVDNPPIGKWQTNSGTATFLMSSVITFCPDGTGSIVEYSTLFDDREIPIFWRVLQPGELQIFEPNEDYPAPINDDDWCVFRYRADWCKFDAGAGPVLINDGIEEGDIVYPKDGFWTFDSPIQLIGRVE